MYVYMYVCVCVQFGIYGCIKYKTREPKYLWASMDWTYMQREKVSEK